jgi:indole-3-glycerol phosphate synthase
MSDILQRILATKRREVAEAAARLPQSELLAQARAQPPARDFVGALRAKRNAGKPAVIAEIKRASPSAGEFRKGLGPFDPTAFARGYAVHGAACLSVLTDREYFQGAAEDLIAARAACTLPVLRKDFIVDPYQIVEARAMGADAVLFIMGAAPIGEFREWEDLALDLGLAVLAESHHAAELEQALSLKTPLIGVNNRDLTRFVTNMQTTLDLRERVPSARMLITESGVDSAETVARMEAGGVHGFLIGGALMSEPDPGAALAALFADRLV